MNDKKPELNKELTAEQRLSLIQKILNAKGFAGLLEEIERVLKANSDEEEQLEPISNPNKEVTPNGIYASLAETKIYDPADIPKVAEDVLNRQNNLDVIDKSVETNEEDVSLGSAEEIPPKKRVLEPTKNNFPDAKVVSPGSIYNNQEML